MKNSTILMLLAVGLLLFSCGGEVGTTQQTSTDTTETSNNTLSDPSDTTPPLPESHNCEVAGQVLEGNQTWIREHQMLVCIVADSTTMDPDFGEGHRILEVYDTKTCERIERQELPVNVSPDFPYYLAEISYNNAFQVVGIKGFSSIFCYDVEARKLLPKLEPQFSGERYGQDAQSGMIHRLEVWENYLVGYAQDFGAFVFDLSDKANPKSILPFAELEQSESFYPLFILPTTDNEAQAIMPSFDLNTEEFSINAVFSQPMSISTNIPESARNNRFLVLRESSGSNTPVALDLLNRKRVDLPADIATKPTQEILNWMKNN